MAVTISQARTPDSSSTQPIADQRHGVGEQVPVALVQERLGEHAPQPVDLSRPQPEAVQRVVLRRR